LRIDCALAIANGGRLRWPKPRCCVDRLHRCVTELEQHTAEQRRQFAERDGELDAARASNRELMTRSTGHTPTGAITRPTRVAHAQGAPHEA
jgi:hypothetical protein